MEMKLALLNKERRMDARLLSGPIIILAKQKAGARKARTSAQAKTTHQHSKRLFQSTAPVPVTIAFLRVLKLAQSAQSLGENIMDYTILPITLDIYQIHFMNSMSYEKRTFFFLKKFSDNIKK